MFHVKHRNLHVSIITYSNKKVRRLFKMFHVKHVRQNNMTEQKAIYWIAYFWQAIICTHDAWYRKRSFCLPNTHHKVKQRRQHQLPPAYDKYLVNIRTGFIQAYLLYRISYPHADVFTPFKMPSIRMYLQVLVPEILIKITSAKPLDKKTARMTAGCFPCNLKPWSRSEKNMVLDLAWLRFRTLHR